MAGAKQLLELTWFNKDKALIPSEEGRYAYEWVDPKDPRYCETRALVVSEVVTGEQSPKDENTQYSERADLAPTEDNLLILGESGDVLEALTRVPELRAKYLGKVKCIYIDPPFNTAQIFANYEDNLEHSVWLTMMRDRLVHLRKLLSDDGSIWVHLDDVENHRMRVLMDEVFGSENFVTEMTWEKTYSPRNDSKGIPAVTDTILVYAKSSEFVPNRLPRTEEMDARYANPDNDVRGPWKVADPTASGSSTHQGMVYAIEHPLTGELIYPSKGRHWAQGQSDVLEEMRIYSNQYGLADIQDEAKRAELCGLPPDEVRPNVQAVVIRGDKEAAREDALELYKSGNWPKLWLTSGGKGGLSSKTYLQGKPGKTPVSFLPYKDVGHTDTAAKEIRALFPGTSAFATPKPERLLERVIHIATNPGDVVLDVFAGSGTTAAVAQKMARRWVTCELVEDTFNRFTRPRLEKVAKNDDPGGVTFTSEREPKPGVEVPAKFDTKDMEDAAKLLRAVRSEQDLSPDEQSAIKTALKLIGTRPSTVRNWRGGGGFTVAHLAPQCFDYVPELGLVTLTEAATGTTLVNSVAANLNFSLTPDNRHFDGKRGSMFLKVVEGRLDKDKAEELLAHLDEGEGVTLAATELEPGVRQFARTTDRPCQIVHIPNDIFTYSATQEGK
ncbi:adenine-specific DNA-methyltransferase [Corynebacterium appendicis CIP 107643]|uniref:Adenine-specific DNA-methyltransferase n=1 Tax=Corynebacterium appendicis CIP 107643 TaxID=1161099 RepID=A0A1N7IV93_9CORY|nr:site-specific DNA-methyltransferase [Corynebacterium appendicis]WJY61011.1 Modification methylase MboII [Corynebacterium appendicis CIP 107643]SIS40946.1 adenine-specific DNA-methyltransferase [Corynebacterium appendicis CIP 107643]